MNLYDDAVIKDPWPQFARLREKGPVVWMEALGNYAFTQYDVVRAALRDDETFISSQGVAADAFGCKHPLGNTVASDGARHDALRQAMQPPLAPAAIEAIRPGVQELANQVVSSCATKGTFDAIEGLAQGLPLTIVRDLVGLPDFGRDNMLKWAGAAFDVLGVQNERGVAACPAIDEMRTFIKRDATPDKLKPGSWTHRISEMAKSGDMNPDLAPFAIRDYINPSLDTTISAIGHLVFHLASEPETWEKLVSDPSLATNAAHEAVRIGTPIRSFSRHTSKQVEIGGHCLPKGARVMMLYASANRDETVFPKAAKFDIERRNAPRHLGFGAGVHMCVGMHLAILEIECLIHAMINQIKTFDIGETKTAMNNSICAFSELPVHVNS